MNITASNAVLVKARAMYGQRLSESDYAALCGCVNIGEIVSYLRSSTVYADVLEGISTGSVHRRQLESLVYEKFFDRLAALCRYESAAGGGLVEYLVLRTDTEQLIHALRNLNSAHPGAFIIKIPEYFSGFSHLRETLYNVSDFNAFAQCVTGTVYEDWFKPYMSQGLMGEVDYSDIELTINKRTHEKIRQIIKKNLIGKQRAQVLNMLNFRSDIENLVTVYRLKKIGCTSETVIRASLYTNESLMPMKLRNDIIASPDCKAMAELLKGTRYEAIVGNRQLYLENTGLSMIYEENKKLLRFSSEPCTVMLSYMFLAENEVRNLNHIIEGVRYGLTQNEIKSLLIGVGD